MHFPYQTEKEINGWFFGQEGKIYNSLAKIFNNKNIIEIGSYQGLSLSYIENTNNVIYAVEPHIAHFKILQDNIKNFKNKRIKLINSNSEKASKNFPDNFFSMVFIDANHKFESVKNDILIWTKKLKKNSILAGHDYDDFWVGVKGAVDQIIKKENITLSHRVWWTFWDGEKYCKFNEQIKNKFFSKEIKLI